MNMRSYETHKHREKEMKKKIHGIKIYKRKKNGNEMFAILKMY